MHPNDTPKPACRQCGKPLNFPPSVLKTRRYCSDPCARAGKRGERGLTPKNVDRFWRSVDTSGGMGACWPFTGPKNQHGYGRFSICQVRHHAHRIAAELVYGPCPSHLRVCHHCDNPACCNPGHLYYGTAADNTRDMINRGRAKFFDLRNLRGEKHPKRKFTAQEVTDMRKRWARQPFNIAAFAREKGVSPQAVRDILRQKNWRHLPSVEDLRSEKDHG